MPLKTHIVIRHPVLNAMGTGDIEKSGYLLCTIEFGIPVITATGANGYLVDISRSWFDLVTGPKHGHGCHAGKLW